MSSKTQPSNPWWYPTKCEEAYFAQLRKDYPEIADMSDEELNEYYNEGKKYQILWDHIGDAYEEYVPLADAFLKAESRVKELEGVLKKISNIFTTNLLSDGGLVSFIGNKVIAILEQVDE